MQLLGITFILQQYLFYFLQTHLCLPFFDFLIVLFSLSIKIAHPYILINLFPSNVKVVFLPLLLLIALLLFFLFL